ncbi:imidazolonepropionase [Desmospora activa]|uniref:Imidazolonepropionase n=1 Tax=Desmospora activa DSM 45169 TaxID=1121389 RepID=A0A2T4ZAV4_9BACL|nr:imidazolonepropionase [Desmospora activa]PTM59006.1 imidazolonepropionase [Desmospora activa DSM 45169]
MTRPIYIRNAAELITFAGSSQSPLTGAAMGELHPIANGSIWIENGVIQAVDRDEVICNQYRNQLGDALIIDASEKLVTPGLVDPHTHLVFAGSREAEFDMRLKGRSYMDIMEAGGGIHATTTATRQASKAQLIAESAHRLDRFLLHGVTTVEAKSGYGLNLEHELKQLEAAQELNEKHPVDIVSTFMGAHVIPVNRRENPDHFVDEVINEMIPEVARRGLAQFNDVFCERGVFTPEQSRRILEAGVVHGLLPKIHADEIEPYGGAELAASLQAVSADHLLKASHAGIKAMATAGVIAVLLPGTAFFLMTAAADGRRMIDAGVPVALSTDCNPGSSPTVSLPFIMNLGCLWMGMTPAEVLAATTINAAHAIRCADRIGSLEVGKQADLVIHNVSDHRGLQYHFGSNHTHTVVKNGKIVVEAGSLVSSLPL